jgi:hypothetical protein
MNIWRSKMEFFNRFPDDDPYAAEYVDDDLSPDVWCNPHDWFNLQNLKDRWQKGMSAPQIIDSENLVNENGAVDRDDAIQWLQNLIEQWEEEEEDA